MLTDSRTLAANRCLWFGKTGLNLNFDGNKRQQSRMEGGSRKHQLSVDGVEIFNSDLTLRGLSSEMKQSFVVMGFYSGKCKTRPECQVHCTSQHSSHVFGCEAFGELALLIQACVIVIVIRNSERLPPSLFSVSPSAKNRENTACLTSLEE